MDGCIYRTKDGECDLYEEGGKYKAFCDMDGCKDRKMSNADRIRSMTGNELASFFRDYVACDDCPVEPKKCGKGWIPCKDVALSWLKKEVKDE